MKSRLCNLLTEPLSLDKVKFQRQSRWSGILLAIDPSLFSKSDSLSYSLVPDQARLRGPPISIHLYAFSWVIRLLMDSLYHTLLRKR